MTSIVKLMDDLHTDMQNFRKGQMKGGDLGAITRATGTILSGIGLQLQYYKMMREEPSKLQKLLEV